MRKQIGWILTPPFLITFVGILIFFQLPLMLLYYLAGRHAFQRCLEAMNRCILLALRIVGTSYEIVGRENIPVGPPIIIVSNHQSMYDIPLLIIHLRRLQPRFIAKRELGRWIPSISFALRKMGSVLIDRGDARQAFLAIEEFGSAVATRGESASIFPEGTRARNGEMKTFKPGGLQTLLRTMPNAIVLPVLIDGAWELLRYQFRPVPFGTRVRFEILPPIERGALTDSEIPTAVERKIREAQARYRSAADAGGCGAGPVAEIASSSE